MKASDPVATAVTMAPTDLGFLEEIRRTIDEYLDRRLPSIDQKPEELHAAIRYSALARAKRFRPILALSVFEALGGIRSDRALGACAALELVHTYSLIHDDLPCMDNDDLRRGLPTLHKKFNEGIAVLAGDALHDLAFLWTAEAGDTRLITELAEAIGSFGMIGGQMADIEAEGIEVNAEQVEFIHRRKTGALIRCSVRFGAILANADTTNLAALTKFGECLGLAFQIIDDILDVEGDQTKLGKSIGSDEKNSKATYPAVVGLADSHRRADELIEQAIQALAGATFPTERLTALAHYISLREN